MSTALAPSPWPAPPRSIDDSPWRFAQRVELNDGGVRRHALQWVLRRNCVLSPRQVFTVYLSMCAVSLLIAAGFWWHGAPYIAGFAGLELIAVGVALAVYSRHATDRETLTLAARRLAVERRFGGRIERVDFRAEWLRVEPAIAQGSLVELAGEGRSMRIGRFLRPEQRAAFAQELRRALRRAQTGWTPQDSELELQR
ncbi:MAG: DUF2244 domain-containing protein [Rubrivivax sp.]